jgi:hypothetical protein
MDRDQGLFEPPPPEPGPEKPRLCEGWNCGSHFDVRYDHVSKAWLCLWCWAKVNPVTYGLPKR